MMVINSFAKVGFLEFYSYCTDFRSTMHIQLDLYTYNITLLEKTMYPNGIDRKRYFKFNYLTGEIIL